MAINKIVHQIHGTLLDISQDTVTAESLQEGFTAHGADGNLIIGTSKGKKENEFDLFPETILEYNFDGGYYPVPNFTPHQGLWRVAHIVEINGEVFTPYIGGYSQGYVTIMGNSMAFGYYGNDRGSFGLTFFTDDGFSRLVLNPDVFPVGDPITLRIYIYVSTFDSTRESELDPYQAYIFKDDILETIGSFSSDWSIVALESSASEIASQAFQYGTLYKVTCPNVINVNENAFYQCRSLADVKLPKATAFHAGAFENCWGLYNLEAPELTEIGSGCFAQCHSLKVLDCPKLQYIGAQAFYSCKNINTLILRSDNLCQLENANAFAYSEFQYYNKNGGTVLVPRNLIEQYTSDSVWSTVQSQYYTRIWAIEDYSVDGTVNGNIDFDRLYNDVIYN